jgi:hypothetical protein
MLSLSADISNATVDLQMINGEQTATAGDVNYASELLAFAEAVARHDDEAALAPCRDALVQVAGSAVLVDAAAVAANFQRMVRIADSTGIPLDELNVAMSTNIRKELKLQRFDTAKHTPAPGWKLRMMGLMARPLARPMLKLLQKKMLGAKP